MRKYIIYKHIGNLSQLNNGRVKELNFISWDDREPVYDIRTWNAKHTEYGKGVTFTANQMTVLKELLNEAGEPMPSGADIIKDYVVEFSRLQDWMMPVKEAVPETYESMHKRYVELKVTLSSLGVNLTELDHLQQ